MYVCICCRELIKWPESHNFLAKKMLSPRSRRDFARESATDTQSSNLIITQKKSDTDLLASEWLVSLLNLS